MTDIGQDLGKKFMASGSEIDCSRHGLMIHKTGAGEDLHAVEQ